MSRKRSLDVKEDSWEICKFTDVNQQNLFKKLVFKMVDHPGAVQTRFSNGRNFNVLNCIVEDATKARMELSAFTNQSEELFQLIKCSRFPILIKSSEFYRTINTGTFIPYKATIKNEILKMNKVDIEVKELGEEKIQQKEVVLENTELIDVFSYCSVTGKTLNFCEFSIFQNQNNRVFLATNGV